MLGGFSYRLAIVVVVIGCLSLAGCPPPPPPPPSAVDSPEAVFQFEKLEARGMQERGQNWRAIATDAVGDLDKTHLHNAQFFVDSQNRPNAPLLIETPRATLSLRGGDIIMENIRIQSQKKQITSCSSATYSPQLQNIHLSGPVESKGPHFCLHASGGDFDISKEELRLEGPISGTIALSPNATLLNNCNERESP